MKTNKITLIIMIFILQLKIITKCFIFKGHIAHTSEQEYVVQILNKGKRCCGTLISENYILTAAHCFVHNDNIKFISVKAININTEVTAKVIKLVKYPAYQERFDHINDIALINLSLNLLKYAFQPLTLWDEEIPSTEIMGKISGYGLTETGSPSNELRTAYVEVINSNLCKINYTDRQFCAGDLSGLHDACDGDSGSSFVVNKTAVGVISTGSDCFDKSLNIKLSRYTFITYYKDWINNIVYDIHTISKP